MNKSVLVLTILAVGTLILQKKHEAAVDALPELERDVMRELLRSQVQALLLFLLALGLAIAGRVAGQTSIAARVAPACVGLGAAFFLFFIRLRAHHIYELAAADDEHERVARARNLQRRALTAFVVSVALWTGALVQRVY